MDDLPIHNIQISGPTLASLLHRFTSSPADIHGLLFGHVTLSTPTSLSDDPIIPPSSSSSSTAIIPTTTSLLIATITSFISLPSHLPLPLNPPPPSIIGYFSGRRRTPQRPSLKESTTTHSLLKKTPKDIIFPPSVFLLLTTPFQDKLIHTHEYKAFQYSILSAAFEPQSLNVVNIGPSFRANYESFIPNSPFPLMAFELSGSNGMCEDGCGNSLKDQKALDGCAEGFEIGKLSKLMGSGASNYVGELEDLYGKMIAKLDGLTRLVEKSEIQVLEQGNHNMKLRRKIAGLE